MSEKRFTYELGDGFSDGFIHLSATEVCELLNELNDENKKLKEADTLLLQIYKQLKLHYMPNAEEQVNKIINELMGVTEHDDDI